MSAERASLPLPLPLLLALPLKGSAPFWCTLPLRRTLVLRLCAAACVAAPKEASSSACCLASRS